MKFEPVDVIPLHNYKIGIDKRFVSLKILRALIKGWYENTEIELIKSSIKPDDRIIELGSGIGITAMIASKIVADAVWPFELNPYLIDWSYDNFKRNGCNLKSNRIALLPANQITASSIDFYIREDFWGSSLSSSKPYIDIVSTPVVAVEEVIQEKKANTLIVDIEGAEVMFFNHTNLTGIKKIIMEVHYGVAGKSETNAMVMNLINQGFVLDLEKSGHQVLLLER